MLQLIESAVCGKATVGICITGSLQKARCQSDPHALSLQLLLHPGARTPNAAARLCRNKAHDHWRSGRTRAFYYRGHRRPLARCINTPPASAAFLEAPHAIAAI